MQETWIQSLGQKDPLEKGMATHSSIFASRGAWQATVHGVTRVGHNLATKPSPPAMMTKQVLKDHTEWEYVTVPCFEQIILLNILAQW